MPSSFDVVTEKQTTHQQRSTKEKAFDNVTAILNSHTDVTLRAHSARVNEIDFRADVGLAAKRVLSPLEYALWSASYLDFRVDPARIPQAMREYIRQRVGQEYIRRGLHNPNAYFKQHQSQEKETSWQQQQN